MCTYFQFACPGIYKQYDTMVFPNDSPVVNKFMTYVGFKMKDSSGAKPELKVPANSDMRHQCLLIYLEKYKNLLFSGFSQEMTISQFVEDVQRIFAALIKIYVTYRIEPHSDETLHSLDCKRDIRPMKQVFSMVQGNIAACLLISIIVVHVINRAL